MSQIEERSAKPKRLRRRLRKVALSLAAALAIALTIKATVAEAYYAPTDSVSPEIPQGSRMLACRICRTWEPGDIVIYDAGGRAHVGRVVGVDAGNSEVTLKRNEQPAFVVASDDVIGKVIANSR